MSLIMKQVNKDIVRRVVNDTDEIYDKDNLSIIRKTILFLFYQESFFTQHYSINAIILKRKYK